jgi:hypothetical protein
MNDGEEENDRKRTDYITTHYRLITCVVCGTYVEGTPLYFNEAGEVVCGDCIVIEEEG